MQWWISRDKCKLVNDVVPVIQSPYLWNISNEYNTKHAYMTIKRWISEMLNENITNNQYFFVIKLVNKYIKNQEHLKHVLQSNALISDIHYKVANNALNGEIEKTNNNNITKLCCSSCVTSAADRYEWILSVSHLDVCSIGMQNINDILGDTYQCHTTLRISQIEQSNLALPLYLEIRISLDVTQQQLTISIPYVGFWVIHNIQCPQQFRYRLVMNLYEQNACIELSDFQKFTRKWTDDKTENTLYNI